MIDLTNYQKFKRDTEGNSQSLEIMVVIGWQDNFYLEYHQDDSGVTNYNTLLKGSPKSDAIFLSSSQQTFGHWDLSDDFWSSKAQELHALTNQDDITLNEISNINSGDNASFHTSFKIPLYWFDFGMKIPFFEEKIDVFSKKYNVNDLTLTFDNTDSKDISAGLNGWGYNLNVYNESTGLNEPYPFGKSLGNFRLTDIIKIRPIVNETVAIYLKSTSASVYADMVPIYRGVVKEYRHDDKRCTISLEDYSESTFNKEFPTKLLPEGPSTPSRYKGRPIPCQIGIIDRAPGIFSRVNAISGIQEDEDGEETQVAGEQDIIYFDSQPLKSFVSSNLEFGADNNINVHQSPLFIYDNQYWNLSQNTADDEGNEIPMEEGGSPNFTFSGDNSKCYLIGSAIDEVKIINPDNENDYITLQEYVNGDYTQDDAIDALVQLYFGSDDEDLDEVDEEGNPIGNEENDIQDEGNVNLFNLQNDTVKNRFRIHAFSKPEEVKVKLKTRARRSSFKDLFEMEVKSYSSQEAHDSNNPDDILDMSKSFNWDSNIPDTTSFVEVKGNIVGRYRYSSWFRTYHYPTFAVDFGSSGTLPFNNYEEITDTSYLLKSTFQCTHSAAFGIYTGSHSLFIDQSSWWVNKHKPAANYPTDQSSADVTQLTAPGGTANSKVQHWHWNIDTIDGPGSDLINNLGLSLDVDNIFDCTSQWAQQNDEINIGPFEMCQRRKGVSWFQSANVGGNYTEVDSYQNELGETHVNTTSGAGYPFTMRLYNVAAFSTILVERNSKYDFYADIIGRTIPGSSSYAARKPADVLVTILNELGSTGAEGYTDRQNSNNLHQDWFLDFSLPERNDMKNYLQGIGESSRVCPSFNSLGYLKFNDIKSKYVYEDTEKINSGDVMKFTIDRSPMREIYNNVTLNYHKDYSENTYEKSITKDFNNLEFPLTAYFDNKNGEVLESSYSEAYFSVTDSTKIVEKIIDCDYIRSESLRKQRMGDVNIDANEDLTANKLINFLIAFHANQHTIIKCVLPLKYFYLETGDIVRFDKLLGDSNILAYGEDYTKLNIRNGQYIYPAFYITNVKRRLDKGIEIECLQMHFLNEYSSSDHGWQEPEQESFEIYGCLDPEAINYDAATTVEVPCLYAGDIDNSGRIDWIDVALIQLAIVQESEVLNQQGGAYFKRLDVDEDNVIGIRDIMTMMTGIVENESNYGCMDGPGNGNGWGPSDFPAADNYDANALIHIQDSCIYNSYACGPRSYQWNWCVSEQDTYNANWACLGSSDFDDPHPSVDLYNDCLIAQRKNDILDGAYVDEWSESESLGMSGDNDITMNSMKLVHKDGLGAYPGSNPENWETPVGFTYETDNINIDEHNPVSGLYIIGGTCDNEEVSFNNHLEMNGNGGYDHFGNHQQNKYCQVPSIFMPIKLKAGHKYIMYNRDYHYLYDDIESTGAGSEYYIGSPFQNIHSNANSSPNSQSQYQQSNSNPTFVAGWFGGCRVGRDNSWGQDSFDEYKIQPRIFTAPRDSSIIPGQWDLPGPGWTPAHPSGNFVWPQMLIDYEAKSSLYGVSPMRTNEELRSHQAQHFDPGGGGYGINSSYLKLKLNASWADYYDDNSFAQQGTLNGNLMPIGYEYETCVVGLYYAEGGFNGFYEGMYSNCDIVDVFDGFGLIDLTEKGLESLVDENLGMNCIDSALYSLDSQGILSEGGY